MNKALAIMQLFCKGQEVGKAAKWKSSQIAANQLAGIVILVGPTMKTVFGLDMPAVDVEQSLIIATTLLAVYNCVATVITSKKVGLPRRWFGLKEVPVEKPSKAKAVAVATPE